MKKLLFLVMAALIITTSCKKKECPTCEEPELHGAGTWNASKVVYQGNDITNSGDPAVNCYLTDVMVLNESQTGTSWDLTYYDSSSSTCSSYDLQVVSWAENWDKQKLYITVTYNQSDYHFAFEFVDENTIKKVWSGGDLEIYYDKQ